MAHTVRRSDENSRAFVFRSSVFDLLSFLFTGWGFSPLLALLSLNDFCRFYSVPSSRT